MAAASNTAFEPYVTSAVAILAFVLAVTNILCPFMVKFILTRHPADEQSRQNTHKLADAKQKPSDLLYRFAKRSVYI